MFELFCKPSLKLFRVNYSLKKLHIDIWQSSKYVFEK